MVYLRLQTHHFFLQLVAFDWCERELVGLTVGHARRQRAVISCRLLRDRVNLCDVSRQVNDRVVLVNDQLRLQINSDILFYVRKITTIASQ